MSDRSGSYMLTEVPELLNGDGISEMIGRERTSDVASRTIMPFHHCNHSVKGLSENAEKNL